MSPTSNANGSELIFEKYELIRQIAVGGMGEIYLARQSGVAGFDRLAILKTLRSKVASDPEVVEDFLDEARIAATLNHPNIVSIYEVGTWRGVYIIAMEFIRGVPLSHFLREEHRNRSHLPYPIAARFIRDAALGLAHAHQAKNIQGESLNIIHRDISPQNIMIRDDGVIKVVDFGIAKAANRAQRTQAGFVKGKLSYMSPEQLVGEPLTSQSDQFSLGILLWEMSTGRRYTPSGDNQAELLQRVVEEPMLPISAVQADVPRELDEIVQKMTANRKSNRFENCRAVADALDEFLENQSERLREQHVVKYIEDLAGEAIADVTHNLKPAGKNLIAQLKPDFQQATVIHYSTDQAKLTKPRDFKKPTIAIAALLLLFIVAGLVYTLKDKDSSPQSSGAKQLELIALQEAQNQNTSTENPAQNAALDIRTIPENAQVFLEGKPLGRSPLKAEKLMANKDIELEIRASGYRPQKRTLSLKPGSTRKLLIELNAAPNKKAYKGVVKKEDPKASTESKSAPLKAVQKSPPPAQPVTPTSPKQPAAQSKKVETFGFLTLQTSPWSRVIIDGVDQGPTPLFKIKLSAGPHKALFINKKAGIERTQEIRVAPNTTTTLNIDLRQ